MYIFYDVILSPKEKGEKAKYIYIIYNSNITNTTQFIIPQNRKQ